MANSTDRKILSTPLKILALITVGVLPRSSTREVEFEPRIRDILELKSAKSLTFKEEDRMTESELRVQKERAGEPWIKKSSKPQTDLPDINWDL